MSNALTVIKEKLMTMWEDKDRHEEMKKIICKTKLTDLEFSTFLEMGKATQLNPFLREIWAVKYDERSPASIFIGRDGYRKAAQRDPEYDFHETDAVYSNDTFKRNSVTGEIHHEYNLKDRGELLGAYCLVKRKSCQRPSYNWVKLSEYSTGKSLWNPSTGKPETMIKKVAECQGLRACFQDLLGGTYSEEEMEKPSGYVSATKEFKSNQLLEKIKVAKGEIIDMDGFEVETEIETGEIATETQLLEIGALISVKAFTPKRLLDALEHYKAESLNQLTKAQANDFISILEKMPDKE